MYTFQSFYHLYLYWSEICIDIDWNQSNIGIYPKIFISDFITGNFSGVQLKYFMAANGKCVLSTFNQQIEIEQMIQSRWGYEWSRVLILKKFLYYKITG